eukprot:XP_008646594.1 uncharacterized protein LOC103628099 [Zea mays]
MQNLIINNNGLSALLPPPTPAAAAHHPTGRSSAIAFAFALSALASSRPALPPAPSQSPLLHCALSPPLFPTSLLRSSKSSIRAQGGRQMEFVLIISLPLLILIIIVAVVLCIICR